MVFADLLRHSHQQGVPLVAVHRGTHAGLVQPNTVAAAWAAVASGGDIVELDVARSADGVYYMFHDGYEKPLLGSDRSILEMTSEEIDVLEYAVHEGRGCGHVERTRDVVAALRGIPLNIDRSWRYWGDGFLEQLAQWGNVENLIVKCRALEPFVSQLGACTIPFPFIPNVRSRQELDLVLAAEGVNLVGLELIATHPGDDLADADLFAELADKGLAIWVNTINLESGIPRFQGLDDQVSVFSDPDEGWGRLPDYHVDIIQTDWPWLAKSYFQQRKAR